MIHCNGCGFGVNELMRFALMKNLCPSCGASLFSSRDTNIITLIQSKIGSERFSSSLTESQVYDISLFFFNEIKHGIGKQIIEELSRGNSGVRPQKVISTNEEVSYDEESVDEDVDIRQEIEREYADHLSQLEPDSEIGEGNEDVFSKAERLKKLHQQMVVTNPSLGKETPINIKRGGFKGITRST